MNDSRDDWTLVQAVNGEGWVPKSYLRALDVHDGEASEAHILAHTDAHTHTHTYTLIHTHAHAHTHSYTHTRTHTHTHTHARNHASTQNATRHDHMTAQYVRTYT